MKVYILFELKIGATGGGNQFLKAIRDYFIEINVYTERIAEADIILYNSHQFIPKLMAIKRQYPSKLFVHRIDGPIRLYSSMNDRRDFVINHTNKLIADASIFQSKWSRSKNLNMGIKKNRFETTILNAPNPLFFNRENKFEIKKGEKIKLIATSWSSNHKKGFKIYKWLDENLNFENYDMTFIGNSPIRFKNIKYKKPMSSKDLSFQLKKHDIYITASQKDPCSNSLIEALHCGLPAIGLHDGGHTEIISKGGELFDKKEEIPALLTKITNNYTKYQNSIALPDINDIGEKYYKFLESVYVEKQTGKYKSKKFNILSYIRLTITILVWKIGEKSSAFKRIES